MINPDTTSAKMKTACIKFFACTVVFAMAGPASPLFARSQYWRPQAVTVSAPYNTAYLDENIYLGIDAGVAWQQDITIRDTVGDSATITFDPGARADLQLGFNFTPNFSTELEVGAIVSPVRSSLALGTDDTSVDLDQVPVLFNVIYHQPLGHNFSAYAGAGVGAVFSQYSDEFGDSTHTDTEFGYQGMAGIKYQISENWDIGVGYKFLGTTRHDLGSGVASDGVTRTDITSDGTMTHSILAAITCRF